MYLSDERAREAYKSFLRKRGIFGFTFNREVLKRFKDVQKESKAYNNSFLGLRNVPLDEIVGSVEKYGDFDKDFIPTNSIIEDRWCRIYKEVMGDANLPPVNLYKIRGEYFVYDGNHRISVAKFMNYKYIEAEVTEFFPSGENEEDVIYKERFAFEKETGLEGINVSKAGSYERLKRNIWDFKGDCHTVEECTFMEAAKEWYKKLYRPIREILINNALAEESKGAGDIFLGYLDHKYYLSEYRKYNVGYTYALIDFINYMKVKAGEGIPTTFRMDKNFIISFRNLYDFDKKIFYKSEYQDKFRMLKEFSERNFNRENHIIGEIELYRYLNDIDTFEEGLKLWFTEVYAEYYEIFLEKSQTLGNPPLFTEDHEIIEDIVRYSRQYRNKNRRLMTSQETVFNYIIDVYLPIYSILEEKKNPEEKRKLYMDISHRYLYYLRYNGEERFVDFERKYLREGSFQNFIGSAFNFRITKGDMFRDIKKLLTYYASTKAEGEKWLDEFYQIVERYNGTENFRTIYNLRESLISTMERDYNTNWVRDVLQKDLEELAAREEVIVNYNTKRVFKYVKGIWEKYSLIDYYATIIPLDTKNEYKSVVDAALEYMKRDFRY